MNESKVDEKKEVRIWGLALIVNGMLVIPLLFTTSMQWTQALWMGCISAVMIGLGLYLRRFSNENGHMESSANH